MSKITILCGTSPLPVCQALKTLGASDAVIVHGHGRSREAAERVSDFCRRKLGCNVVRIEVDPVNPYPIKVGLYDMRDRMANSDLVYGAGTSPMNALIHEFWRNQDNAERKSWYLGIVPRKLYETDRDVSIDVSDTGLDLTELMELHLESGSGIVHSGSSRTMLSDSEIEKREFNEKLGRAVQRCLYGVENLDEDAKDCLRWVGWKGQESPGALLEVAMYAFLSGLAPGVAEVRHSVKAAKTDSAGQTNEVLEMDVVVAHGDRLLAVSCNAGVHQTAKSERSKGASTLSTKRHKFFEVKSQAPRLGGRECRTMTVTVDRGRKDSRRDPGNALWTADKRCAAIQEQRVALGLREIPMHSDRDILVDLAEVLGDDPAAALDTPDSLQVRSPWLFEWLCTAGAAPAPDRR